MFECQKRAEWIKEGAIEVGNADDGEVIRFGELPSQLGWITLVKGVGHKEVKLVGVADSRLVGDARADAPHVRQLAVDPADIAALAVDRALPPAEVLARIVSFCDCAVELVGGGEVIVHAAKKLGERIDVGISVGVVINHLAVGNGSRCVGSRQVGLEVLGDGIKPIGRNLRCWGRACG